jgi:hypothetical protein
VNMPQIYTVHAPGKIHFMIPGRIDIGANQRNICVCQPNFVLRARNQEEIECLPNICVSSRIFVNDFYNNPNDHGEGYG